ncbi:uncharacterized protein LOC128035455 [Gossypium raimondii]|uniref:uncharacterized protein LOC128035455 n=1 Tax=Gossypium raimondii TaxID=29730 RepID=UPI00227CFB36|nr:uncharacterized protein LOC128035455 [Gossypium raimondii]
MQPWSPTACMSPTTLDVDNRSSDHEEFDEHHKIDLRLLGTDWPLYWSVYTEMWENRNEYLPTREPIIVPELACIPEYMPWFRAHGKPYLLTPEERRRQIRVGREMCGPQNPRGQNYEGSPSTRPKHSPGSSSATMQSPSPTRAPTQSPGAAIQQMIPTHSPFPMMPGWSQMPGSAPFPVMPSEPPITRPSAQEGSQGGPSGSSPFYQSPATHGFQTPSPFMMQTPPHTLFFEGGSSSQVRQPDAEPEEPESPPEEQQPPLEARERRNPIQNRLTTAMWN